jgi:hypothetical protein
VAANPAEDFSKIHVHYAIFAHNYVLSGLHSWLFWEKTAFLLMVNNNNNDNNNNNVGCDQ